jgi:hypothetical protein
VFVHKNEWIFQGGPSAWLQNHLTRGLSGGKCATKNRKKVEKGGEKQRTQTCTQCHTIEGIACQMHCAKPDAWMPHSVETTLISDEQQAANCPTTAFVHQCATSLGHRFAAKVRWQQAPSNAANAPQMQLNSP